MHEHEHQCTVYDTQEQQFSVIVPFLKTAFDSRQRCLYVADENSVKTTLETLERGGLNISRHLQDGSFEILEKQDTFVRAGTFDPDAMISFLSNKADDALSRGHPGLRVLGEMTWALGANLGNERLLEFESKLNKLLPSKPLAIICQYNRRLFPPEVIIGVIETHPLVVYDARVSKNPYYVPPEELLRPDRASIRLERLLENIRVWNRNEEELSAIADRFRSAFLNAPLGMVILSADKRIVDANPAYCRLVGYSNEELRGMSIMDLTHPADRAEYGDRLMSLLEGKSPAFVYEKRYLTKRRAVLWDEQTISVAAIGFGGSKPTAIAIVQDVTARKQSDMERNRLASVVEKASDFIGICDLDLKVLFVNPAGLKLVGLSSITEAQGTKVTDYFFPEDAEYMVREVFPRVRVHRTWSGELRFRHFRTGEPIPVAFYDVFTIDDPQTGKPVNIATVTRDIRGEKRAQQELQRSFDELLALSARLETIREDERKRVAREIHDQLGQALTAIKIEFTSFLDTLAPEALNPSKAKSIVSLVNQTIDSVRRISTELRPRILDDLGIVAALEWMSEDFETRTGKKVSTDLPGDFAIDPEQATAIFRIAQEALTNIARHADATHVEVSLRQSGVELILQIMDDGIGIPEGTIGQPPSVGILGMQERAALIGAKLSISSTPGRGTTVRLRVPLLQKAQGA